MAINKTKAIRGFANPDCYARSLSGCCRQMSGEHPLSRAVLELIHQELGVKSKAVRVRNMGFQPRDTIQSIGIGSLESKILCTRHNNELADFDAEALAAFKAFESLYYDASGQRKASEPIYAIDGDRFERWLLKVLCGCLYGGMMSAAGSFELKGVEPPLDWLEMLYEHKPLPDNFGLYSEDPGRDEAVTIDHSVVKWGSLVLHNEIDTTVQGLRLFLFGFRFTLLATGPQPRAVEALAGQSYRPNSFTIDGAKTRVNFAWDSGPGSGETGLRFV